MITALSWIPRGVTPRVLEQCNTSNEEMDRYLAIIQGNQEVPVQQPQITEEDADIIAKYDMDNYDNDAADGDDAAPPDGVEMDDPYQVPANGENKGGEEDIDEDDEIRTDDFLLMVGKYGEEIPTLEIHLFDEKEETMFVHHELMLPSFPLAIRWMDYEPQTGKDGSFAAVSSMRSEIEIWNLNVEDPICPAAVLQYHQNSVPGLSWNVQQRSVLLSASIDGTAAIWSLESLQTAATYNIGAECKSAEWSQVNATVFAVATSSGIHGFDAREGKVFNVMPDISVESMIWSSDGNQIMSSLTTGDIIAFDVRNIDSPLFQFKAHQGAANCISLSRNMPVVASVGEDEQCKIWALDGEPHLVAEDDMKVGQIFTCLFCPDKPTLLAVGGETGTALWDIANLF